MRAMRNAAAIALLALAGCAEVPPAGPSVMALPGRDKSLAAFQADDANCRQFAAQQIGAAPADAADRSLAGSAALGTLLGAAAGALITAAGNPAAGVAIGAGSGLAAGTAWGLGAARDAGFSQQQSYDLAYGQCMRMKGEKVPPAAIPKARDFRVVPYPYAPYPNPPFPLPYPYAYPSPEVY